MPVSFIIPSIGPYASFCQFSSSSTSRIIMPDGRSAYSSCSLTSRMFSGISTGFWR